MAAHIIEIQEEKEFYLYFQEHKRAIIVPKDAVYVQWDTLILQCNIPRWKNLPVYKTISYVEEIKGDKLLLHLK